MYFDSLWFLYLFLPFSIFIYLLTPFRFKNLCLLFLTIVFLGQIHPLHPLIMMGSITIDYGLSRLMQRYDENYRVRYWILMASLVKNIGLLLFAGICSKFWWIPAGLSVYTLTSVGYLIDVYRGDAVYETNYIDFALFCTMFPKFVMGPILNYTEFAPQLKKRKYTIDTVARGISLFVLGLAKKVILADHLLEMSRSLGAMPKDSITVVSAWLMVAALGLGFYMTLSSYGEMACGLGLVFGFQLPRSFEKPFQAVHVSEFLSNFHTTVSRFFKRQVYLPLGGQREGTAADILNILAYTILIGLWYSLDMRGLLWGTFLGLLIAAEQYFLRPLLKKIPSVFCRLGTLFFVFLSFLLLLGPNGNFIITYAKALFGIGVEMTNSQTMYRFHTNWFAFSASCLCATHILHPIWKLFGREEDLAFLKPKKDSSRMSRFWWISKYSIVRAILLLLTASLFVLVTVLI